MSAVRKTPAALRRAQERRRVCPVDRAAAIGMTALGGLLWLATVALGCWILLSQPGH